MRRPYTPQEVALVAKNKPEMRLFSRIAEELALQDKYNTNSDKYRYRFKLSASPEANGHVKITSYIEIGEYIYVNNHIFKNDDRGKANIEIADFSAQAASAMMIELIKRVYEKDSMHPGDTPVDQVP